MSLQPSVEEQDLLADTFRLAGTRLSARERISESVSIGGLAVAVGGLWWLQPPTTFALLPAALCILVMVFATRVRFDTPLGLTVATQLAFVPLLFVVPGALVPLAVIAALVIARLPELYARAVPPSRLLLEVGNAWFAVGPVLVFAIAATRPDAAGPLLLLAALGAQFLVDFTTSAARFWFDRAASLATQIRDAWVYGIDAALSGIALVVAQAMHRTPAAALAPIPLLALLGIFARERHQRMESLLELNAAYQGTALVLGDVVQADDGYTGEHCKSVVRLALSMAGALKLDAEQRRNLEFAALLHDVGKIAIPKEIINKPGQLDPDEWEVVTTHTVEGQKMLDRIGGFMRNVGLIVRSHHERWDGSGYPDRLAGPEIPLEARIISCCDAWNAMRTNRSYRQAMSYRAARVELAANAGRQFDPRIVEAFLALLDPVTEGGLPEDVTPSPAAFPRHESGVGLGCGRPSRSLLHAGGPPLLDPRETPDPE